jgi:maltose alpha-D-glucosyltransferase/alpha-amylase
MWYKDAIFYELHVRAFFDSNGDGIGDFRGLTEKLDYLEELGITAVWLLPFYPSPGRDDGYDISDYTDVNPVYGTLREFERFVEEAHRRGIRVITELVVNHTSDQHPWFQRARRSPPGSPWREFYVWTDDPSQWSEARIIFKDFETSNWTFDRVAGAYYWHRFYSHQPDLNFRNPAVRKAVAKVLDFWMDLGVDGMRLDAIPYLFERDGTNCENLPETHEFLKWLRRHLDSKYEARIFLGEANQWPEDAVAYFGNGDECHMNFHFPLMPRLFMAIHMEDRFPVIDILQQTPEIPPTCQWALFLRNHDELTLEMVTDEERDYMYRVYAHDPQARVNLGIRRRLAPLLGNDRRRIELMNGLLFSLPGTPVLYYGDEIGMGDNYYLGDRNAVRTPMQWSADRNAGFSRANPQRLYLPVIIDPEYHYETVNVEAQSNNPHSLLWWMRRLIALRKRFKAFGRGSLEFLYPENRKVLAFLRHYEEEHLLVVANVSRFVQYVDLDLSKFRGLVPVELFGRTEFPPIGDPPYRLTLGPHGFYWFALERRPLGGAIELHGPASEASPIELPGDPLAILHDENHPARSALEERIPAFLQSRRWFGGKARRIKGVHRVEAIPLESPGSEAAIAIFRVEYVTGSADRYLVPLRIALGDRAEQIRSNLPQAIVAPLRWVDGSGRRIDGILYDALEDASIGVSLYEAVARRRHLRGLDGEVVGSTLRSFRRLRPPTDPPAVSPVRADQTHTSLVLGERLILKVFRRLDDGVNPEVEIGTFLTDRVGFRGAPAVAGFLEYRPLRGTPATLAVLHEYVPNTIDGWQHALDALGTYLDRALARSAEIAGTTPQTAVSLELLEVEPPPLAYELIGPYLDAARLLGKRTAELHRALASRSEEEAFAPEPFTTLYQRSLYQGLRNSLAQVFQLLRERRRSFPDDVRELADRVLELEGELLRRAQGIRQRQVSALRTRTHGDYHLRQVLWTGKDFVVIDFEGEPARTLSERRIKRSPLRDVAGMLRSFQYAAYAAHARAPLGSEAAGRTEPGAERGVLDFWTRWVSAEFLRAYLREAAGAGFLPKTREELGLLLDVYRIDKALYELRYELENRPDWVRIPLQGILDLGAAPSPRAAT